MAGKKRKDCPDLEEIKTIIGNNKTEDVCEYLELLNGLTVEEKREVKGIMTGMKVMKGLLAIQSV